MKKKKPSILTLGAIVVAVVLVVIVFTSRPQRAKSSLIENGYYNGPMVNKNGDLVNGDGVMIKRGYAPERARKRFQTD